MSNLSTITEQIKRKVSVIDIVSRYAKVHKRGSNYVACCPFHKEKTPSFYIYEDNGNYHCYGCKAHGDIFTILMEKKGLSFMEAMEELSAIAGIKIPRAMINEEQSQEKKDKIDLYYEILEKATTFFYNQLFADGNDKACAYIIKRGIDKKTIAKFRLGYAPKGNHLLNYLKMHGCNNQDMETLGLIKQSKTKPGEYYDYFRDRVIFPIFDVKGRTIAFGGRVLGVGEPKYLNSPETPLFHKSNVVYGYNFARAELSKTKNSYSRVICCEGYMDVIALYQYGYVGAVAPLGTSFTDTQLSLLWRLSHEPIMCFDGDFAGNTASIRAMENALPLLKAGYSLQFVFLPQGHDPDSLILSGSGNQLAQYYDSAESLIDTLWNHLVDGVKIDTPEQKAALKQRVYHYTEQIKDTAIRKGYEFDINARLKRYFYQFAKQKSISFPQNSKESYLYNNIKHGNKVDVYDAQIKILMACIVNNPTLLHELEQEIIELHVKNDNINELRNGMVDYLNSRDDQEHSLHEYLSKVGLDAIARKICNSDVYTHAQFALPCSNMSSNDRNLILDSWRAIWMFCQCRNSMEQDLINAKEQFIRSPTKDSLAVIKKIQYELDELKIQFTNKDSEI